MRSRPTRREESVDVEFGGPFTSAADNRAEDAFAARPPQFLGLEEEIEKLGDRDLASAVAGQHGRDVTRIQPTLERGTADTEQSCSLRGPDGSAERRFDLFPDHADVVKSRSEE